MRKICFITGTRAEYGLLSRLIKMVDESPDCTLQIIATNMHLLPEFGETYREIEKDGFKIDAKVAMSKPSDDAYGIVSSMAQELSGMNETLATLKPDLAVILGDRYEMLVAAMACMMHHIPIAHIHGGEITEGASDDCIRHAITKLSNLHFTATEEYRNRVIQLGEQPDHTFYVGALGVENINEIPLVSMDELSRDLGIELNDFLLATYHPLTLGDRTSTEDIGDFLSALDRFPEKNVIFTMPNSDQGADSIREAIENWCSKNSARAKCFDSLGIKRYLSLMHYAQAVVGNSSSGLIEAPSAGVPTLNIGDRQKGRTRGKSVVDCKSDTGSIVEGLAEVLSPEMRRIAQLKDNPYHKQGTAREIFNIISTHSLSSLTRKKFYDLPN